MSHRPLTPALRFRGVRMEKQNALCPLCTERGRRYKLYPVLLDSTSGRDIPLYCRGCKTQFLVNVPDPQVITIAQVRETTKYRHQ